MCERHRSLLVHQAQYTEAEPWLALIVCAQIALFQAATCDPQTHERTGGDIAKLSAFGCLACYKPDAFGEIVEAAKSHDLGTVKALGERWVAEARRS